MFSSTNNDERSYLCGPSTTPQTWLIHQRVAQIAHRAPDALAVFSEEKTLTYAQLQHEARSMALRMASCQQGITAPVAILLPSCADRVVAMLAALSLNGYLPLSIDYPAQRIARALALCHCATVVTQTEFLPLLEQSSINTVLVLDAQEEEQAPGKQISLVGERQVQDCATYFLTSGSTGEPKVISLSFLGWANLLSWQKDYLGLTPQDRIIQFAPTGFDACSWDTWVALCAGASLFLVPEHIRQDPFDLHDWIIEHQCTTGFITTRMGEALMELQWPRQTALRSLLVGGERLRRYPPAHLPFDVYNVYGPTETTAIVTACHLTSGHQQAHPPLGTPINNTEIFLLDEADQLVQRGEAGEIAIAGPGLALGYLNQEETQRHFGWLHLPKRTVRIYRTGDKGRLDERGQLEFLGRMQDDEVKIRGVRVSLAEVEQRLLAHPLIVDASVLSKETEHGSKIVAFCVRQPGQQISEEEVRAWLAQSLQAAMIPSTFVFLPEALPLSAHQKVDQTRLWQLYEEDIHRRENGSTMTGRTPLQEQLQHVVAELLDKPVEQIGVEGELVELGLDSLALVSFLIGVQQIYDVELHEEDVPHSFTISSVAAVLETNSKIDASQAQARLEQFLAPEQEGDYGQPGADVYV